MSALFEKMILQKRQDVDSAKSSRSPSAVRIVAEEMDPPLDFGCALLSLSDTPIQIIAECHPSAWAKDGQSRGSQAAELAQAFARGGAAAISVVTDGFAYGGSLDDLRRVRSAVDIPVLRHDFIIDEYQIYESRSAGADSFSLYAGALDEAELQYFIEIGRELGMEPLLLAHNHKDLERVLRTDGKLVGLSALRLDDFSLDLEQLTSLIKPARERCRGRLLIWEAAVANPEMIRSMKKAGFSAFLSSEALITKGDPEAAVRELIGYPRPLKKG